MSEVLVQSELDELLAAVESGEAAAANSAAVVPQPSANASLPGGAPHAYDFRRPERVSKDHIRALGSIHDVFARNFSATLSGFLRTIIDVRVVGVEQLTYSEFVQSLPNPTCFVIMQAPPLEGQMCLELSPLIVYPIIDRLLGGNNSELFIPQRPLTAIEWRLIIRPVERALEHLSEVWKNLVDAKFEIVDTESNPQLAHIVAPSEVVVFITFEIEMGAFAGTMGLCVPFNTIETVLSRLTTRSWFGYRPKDASELQKRRLQRNLTQSTVGLTAYLGQARIRLSDLRTMQPGDLIRLDKEPTQDLIVQIQGRTKYAARAGQHRGRRAIRLLRPAEIDEPL